MAQEEIDREKAIAEENNPMKALENRTADSKREMDILDALDELRTRNARNERVDANSALDRIILSSQDAKDRLLQIQEEEDAALARSHFQNAQGEYIRRVEEDGPEDSLDLPLEKRKLSTLESVAPAVKKTKTEPLKKTQELLGIIRKTPNTTATTNTTSNSLGLLGTAYDSDSD